MATNFKTELLENKKLKIDLIAGPDNTTHFQALLTMLLIAQNQASHMMSLYQNLKPTKKLMQLDQMGQMHGLQ